MFYLAYGSNMNHQQMKKRCPGARFLRRVYVESYKFVYDGQSNSRNSPVANIVSAKGGRVWGGLFEINEDNLAALDRYEDYPNSYDRSELDAKDDQNNLYKAWAYYRTGKNIGEPSEEYRGIVIEGARNCGLPEEYVQSFLCPGQQKD